MKIKINKDSKLFNVFCFLLNMWCSTLRINKVYENDWINKKTYEDRSWIYAFWHDEIFPLCYLHKNKGFYAMVSPSRDGEILAGVLSRWGYKLFRGSSHKNPVGLIKLALRKAVQKKIDIGIAVDGPTGPRHKVKEGVIFLGYKANAYITPIRVIIKPSIKLNSWDKFQIPIIGSKCHVIYGEPYTVSYKYNKISSQKIRKEVFLLEKKLRDLGNIEYYQKG